MISLGEAEGLECLDAAGLDAVGLADGQPSAAALHDARGDVRELGELRCGEHARRAGAHDEHVDLVGKLVGPVRCRRRRPAGSRVTGYVTVVVKLHGLSSLRCVAAVGRSACSI
jgi:hypothetical protein